MKKENRGGAREGAGRKKKTQTYSDKFKKGMYSALAMKAKETGKTIQEVIVDMAYTNDKKWGNMRIAAAKLIADVLVTKESHSTIEKHEIGPQIGLPPIKQPDNETIYPAKAKEFVN